MANPQPFLDYRYSSMAGDVPLPLTLPAGEADNDILLRHSHLSTHLMMLRSPFQFHTLMLKYTDVSCYPCPVNEMSDNLREPKMIVMGEGIFFFPKKQKLPNLKGEISQIRSSTLCACCIILIKQNRQIEVHASFTELF